jgi:hypothetical protein
MAHLTVSMAPNFTTFTLWPLRNTAWPPLRTTGLDRSLVHYYPFEAQNSRKQYLKIQFL